MNARYPLFILYSLFFFLQACDKDDDTPTDTTAIVCLPTSLSANVIAFYPFSNGSLNDFSGNGMHLANNTTAKAAPDRNENTACAFEFDNYPAVTDSLTTGIVQKLTGVSTFSVSLWYMPLDTNVQSGTARVENMIAYDKWNINLYDCRKPNFGYFDNSTKNGWSVWDTNMVAYGTPAPCQVEQVKRTGVWHHLVVTFDKANNKAKIYRDGMLCKEDASYMQTSTFVPYQPAVLILGSTFTGRLDDVAIFDKALTDAEVGIMYQAAPCCSQ